MTATTALPTALRRLRARGFASASAPPPPPSQAGAATASASSKTTKKKASRDSRFATVGLPLLLFVAGGYVALTQVRPKAAASSTVVLCELRY